MKIKQAANGDVMVVTLEGSFLSELDQFEFRQEVYRLIEQDCKQVVVDLSYVEHINSLGLGGLIATMTSLRREGGDLKLCAPQENVRKVLKITRLDHVFEIGDSLKKLLVTPTKT